MSTTVGIKTDVNKSEHPLFVFLTDKEIIISWQDNHGLKIAGQFSRTQGGCKMKFKFFELLTFQIIFLLV